MLIYCMTWVHITHYIYRSIQNKNLKIIQLVELKYLTFHKIFGLVFNSCIIVFISFRNEGVQLTQLIIKKTTTIIR
jgi:hypothetical protein